MRACALWSVMRLDQPAVASGRLRQRRVGRGGPSASQASAQRQRRPRPTASWARRRLAGTTGGSAGRVRRCAGWWPGRRPCRPTCRRPSARRRSPAAPPPAGRPRSPRRRDRPSRYPRRGRRRPTRWPPPASTVPAKNPPAARANPRRTSWPAPSVRLPTLRPDPGADQDERDDGRAFPPGLRAGPEHVVQHDAQRDGAGRGRGGGHVGERGRGLGRLEVAGEGDTERGPAGDAVWSDRLGRAGGGDQQGHGEREEARHGAGEKGAPVYPPRPGGL